MIPQSFLLAVPIGWKGRDVLEMAEHPADVRSANPRLWLGAGTRSIELEWGARIIGPLFQRGRSGLVDARGDGLPARGSPSKIANWLSRECWGAYLAILPGHDDGGPAIFVDPSGLLPVYRLLGRTHVLIASEARLFAQAGAGRPAIDWAALGTHLCWPELRQTATCLAGVDELTPGTLYHPAYPAKSPQAVWRPQDFMPSGREPDFREAITALRTCLQEVVGAWADLAGPLAVAASGGVDSSLICAALALDGHPFSCVTLATADPSGDEQVFVKALADHLGVTMVAGIYEPASVDLTQSASAGLPSPNRRTLALAIDAELDKARCKLGANAIFDGNGGDSLFCFLHSAAPVVDRLQAAGMLAAWPTLRDMCAVTGADLPTMLKAMWRRMRRKTRPDRWPADWRMLANVSENTHLPSALTPWFDVDVGIHGGKHDHLALIMRAQNHIHGLDIVRVPRFSPLMSQPLVELCLSLPTWLWCRGGINRALARAAFADVLPKEVLRRTSKAGPDSFLRHLFARNRAQIRTTVLDGHLARNALLNREAVEAAMATDSLSSDAVAYRLLDLCEAEAWVTSWIGQG